MKNYTTLLLCGIAVLAACAEEPPPRSVTEFLDNPILLEAAMVRCSQDRARSRYEAECVNARQAASRIQAKEEAERRASLEASSERKRKALRRTQEAAAEARRRAAEAARKRREAEYLAQFGVLPPSDSEHADEFSDGNLPGAVVTDEVVPDAVVPDAVEEPDSRITYDYTEPAVDGGNAPVAVPETEAEAEPPASDLASIRDELRRRNEDDGN